jgi:hypothetical protein
MLSTLQLAMGAVTCWRFFLPMRVLMELVLFPMLILVLFTSFLRMSDVGQEREQGRQGQVRLASPPRAVIASAPPLPARWS